MSFAQDPESEGNAELEEGAGQEVLPDSRQK